MRDIEIHYNPYKMKTTMRIEGLMYARAVIIAVSSPHIQRLFRLLSHERRKLNKLVNRARRGYMTKVIAGK